MVLLLRQHFSKSDQPILTQCQAITKFMNTHAYPLLLSPLDSGFMRLVNRVVMGSMHTGLEATGDWNHLANFYAERANRWCRPHRHRWNCPQQRRRCVSKRSGIALQGRDPGASKCHRWRSCMRRQDCHVNPPCWSLRLRQRLRCAVGNQVTDFTLYPT